MRRTYQWLSLGVLVAAGITASACGDDDDANTATNTTPDGGSTPQPDSGSTGADGSAPVNPTDAGDGGKADAGGDADAGPTVTSSFGPTGQIDVFNDGIFAYFWEDETILRASDSTECVAHFRSETKPLSPAGTVTIGGDIVNWSGGAQAPMVLTPSDGFNAYEYYDSLVFPTDDEFAPVQVEKTSTTVFPAIAVRDFQPPPSGQVTVTAPVKPASGDLIVPSGQDLTVAWTVPAKTTGLQLRFRYGEIVVNGKWAHLFCTFPLAAGTGRVPASLLSAIRTRLGAAANGSIRVYAGGAAEIAVGNASYSVMVTRSDSTNFSNGDDTIPAKLE
jgi:hypothetical protein